MDLKKLFYVVVGLAAMNLALASFSSPGPAACGFRMATSSVTRSVGFIV